ncbi:MAG: hypothetical protein ABJB55_02060 [Actinomycetota bacterium]
MDDLELLKGLPGRIGPPDVETKERMRAVVEARSAVSRVRRPRRAATVGTLGIAAVIAAASLAAAIAVHPWTVDDPIALQGIADPGGPISSKADLEAVVAEFTPAIRLPDGGSFEVWVQRQESIPEEAGGSASSMIGSGLNRGIVVHGMVFVAQCQWGQRWLDASSGGDQTGTAQALRVVAGINDWFRSNAPDDDFGTSYLLDAMRNGDPVGVQSEENICGYTGSWGSTPAQQDTAAQGRLTFAAETAQRYLRNDGDTDTFSLAAAGNLAPDIDWTNSHLQPAPASPGAVFIGPSSGEGVTLVAASETGTQFCAVVTVAEVQRGTTTNDLSTVENADGTAVNATVHGPITCNPEGW